MVTMILSYPIVPDFFPDANIFFIKTTISLKIFLTTRVGRAKSRLQKVQNAEKTGRSSRPAEILHRKKPNASPAQ